MGYYVQQLDTRFRIRRANLDRATALIREASRILEPQGLYPAGVKSHCRGTVPEALAAAFLHFLWEPAFDDSTGDIDDLEFVGEKCHAEYDLLFETLAPVVESGSFISMMGDDAAIWRWSFRDGQCRRIAGRLEFEEHDET